MPRKLLPWFAALVIVVLGLGVWIGILLYRLQGSGAGDSAYSAVYMQTGEVYYGRLQWWPKLHIEDPWYLTRDAQSGQAAIVPFSSTFSGPSSDLYLNPDQIVWWVRLRSDSEVAKGLQGAANIIVPPGQ